MSTPAETPPAAANPLQADWSKYAHDVRLLESERETGAVPASVPDRLALGDVVVEMERGSWSVACTGAGVATVAVGVRRRDVQVTRPGGMARPRVFIGGARVLVADAAVPDTSGPASGWVEVRFYASRVSIEPYAGNLIAPQLKA